MILTDWPAACCWALTATVRSYGEWEEMECWDAERSAGGGECRCPLWGLGGSGVLRHWWWRGRRGRARIHASYRCPSLKTRARLGPAGGPQLLVERSALYSWACCQQMVPLQLRAGADGTLCDCGGRRALHGGPLELREKVPSWMWRPDLPLQVELLQAALWADPAAMSARPRPYNKHTWKDIIVL